MLVGLLECRPPETVGLTELVVLVDTDLGAPDTIDHVQIIVEGPAGFHFDRTAALDEIASPRMPLVLGLVHDSGALEPLSIRVTGTGPGGTTLTQSATTGFVSHASRLVSFVLTDPCLGATCPSDRTCTGRERCDLIARDVSSLPDSTAVTDIAAGQYMTCARLTNGRVKCWGRSIFSPTDPPLPLATSTPTTIANLDDATDVAVGDTHGCAIRRDGSVACWGDGRLGMLGSEGVTLQPDAVNVAGVSGAVGLALGRSHSCARLTSGDVTCWGSNGVGQLGNGGMTNSATPVPVTLSEPALEIDAGTLFSCARGVSGAVYCWGFNTHGELGDGSTTQSPVPVRVLGIDDAVEVATGSDYACARRRAGTVMCWGSNDSGQLGDGTTGPRRVTPALVIGPTAGRPLSDVVSLALGYVAACARVRGGRVLCWGGNGSSQLGDGTTDAHRIAAPVLEGGARPFENALAIASGSFYSCLIDRERAVLCWGINQDRQLGTVETTALVAHPRVVTGLP